MSEQLSPKDYQEGYGYDEADPMKPPGSGGSVEADVETRAEAIRNALENVGPCDTEERNPHREVWCIAHQQKRCHADAETAEALQALTNLTDRIGSLEARIEELEARG